MTRHTKLNLPCILQLPLANVCFSLFLRKVQELKIPPMVKRTGSISRQNKEDGRPCHGNKVKRQKDDELNDLSDREWRVLRFLGRLSESFHRRIPIWIDDSGIVDKLFVALCEEYRIEDVDQCLIDEECLEESSNEGSTLS